MPRIIEQTYGKTNVRVVKVERGREPHVVHDLRVQVELDGDLESAYTRGDNTNVLPTDTMKNTVYALAQPPFEAVEEYAARLTAHFLRTAPQLTEATVSVWRRGWERIGTTAFSGASQETRFCRVRQTGMELAVEGGIRNLEIMKSADSGFTNFYRDAFTTLPDDDDRLLGTILQATWRYADTDFDPANFNRLHATLRDTLLQTFADHHSASVQQTLFAMGEAALEIAPVVAEIELEMPNVHRLLVDLSPFGLENDKEIFKPIDEPSGMIRARVGR